MKKKYKEKMKNKMNIKPKNEVTKKVRNKTNKKKLQIEVKRRKIEYNDTNFIKLLFRSWFTLGQDHEPVHEYNHTHETLYHILHCI